MFCPKCGVFFDLDNLDVVCKKDCPMEQKRRDKMTINGIKRDDVEEFATRRVTDIKNLLDEYQRIATQSAIYPGKGTPLGLNYVALKGAGEAGEFAEHVGKAM